MKCGVDERPFDVASVVAIFGWLTTSIVLQFVPHFLQVRMRVLVFQADGLVDLTTMSRPVAKQCGQFIAVQS